MAKPRVLPSEGLAGERGRRLAPNGSVYVLFDAFEQGIDAGGEYVEGAEGPRLGLDGDADWKPWRWATVCDTHGTICGHPTLKLAQAHLPFGEWCEACQEGGR